MRVLLACRAFDVDNDHRIRKLVNDERVARIEVRSLTDGLVDAAVTAMNLPASELTVVQRSLLSLPLNLVLLQAIADQPDALAFTSATGLLNAYWDRKHRDCTGRRQPPAHFTRLITVLANAMSARQQLSAPVSVLDADELAADADVLASEHVLVRDRNRYAFFHEAFFDYAFARLWINRDQDLVAFLLDDEQELFVALKSVRFSGMSATTTRRASSVRWKRFWGTPISDSTSRLSCSPSSTRSPIPPWLSGR